MLKRVIPCLLLSEEGLYKTTQFKKPKYIGDPINAVKIFNDKEVDELVFLDISATENNTDPNFKLLKEIASECFMPLAYGGGINKLEQAKRIFECGIEKVSLNSSAINNPKLIEEIANIYGNQSVIVSIDYKKNIFGKNMVFGNRGKKNTKISPKDFAKKMENNGAGEILLTNIQKEGTWSGYDIDTVNAVTDHINIPLIANGGAGNISDIAALLNNTNSSAASIGSMAVYQKKDMGVLINFPPRNELERLIK